MLSMKVNSRFESIALEIGGTTILNRDSIDAICYVFAIIGRREKQRILPRKRLPNFDYIYLRGKSPFY